MICEHHMYTFGGYIHIYLSAAGVNHHIYLALIHGDGNISDDRLVKSETFEHALDLSRSLTGSGKIISADIKMQLYLIHLPQSLPSVQPHKAYRRR